MGDQATHQLFQVLAVDVQQGDMLTDQIAKRAFMWPNCTMCDGWLGPWLVERSEVRGRLVEIIDSNEVGHLYNTRTIVNVWRPV